MRKKFKDVIKDIHDDVYNFENAYYSCCDKKPGKLVRKLYDKGLDIKYERYDGEVLSWELFCLIPAGLGYAVTSIWNSSNLFKAARAAGHEAAQGKLSEFYANLKATVLEKYPVLKKPLENVEGEEVLDVLKTEHSHSYANIDGQIIVNQDYGNYVVDGSWIVSEAQQSAQDIVDSCTNLPTLTECVTTPTALLLFGAIMCAPAAYYYAVPKLGEIAIRASIAGQHIKEYAAERIGSSSKTTTK